MLSFRLGRKKREENEDEEEASGGEESPPPPPSAGRRFGFRRLLLVLVVLVLGGGLGTVGYYVANTDVGDMIGALDVADPAKGDSPRLAMRMPWRGGKEPAPTEPAAAPAPGTDQPPVGAPASAPVGGLALPTPPPSPEGAPVPPPPVPAPPAPLAVPGQPAPAETGDSALPPAALPPAALPSAALPPAAFPPAPPAVQSAAAQPAAAPDDRTPKLPKPRDPAQPPSFDTLPSRTDVKALAPAPVADLVRQSPGGPLPVVASDGRQAWKTYALPFEASPEMPIVAVIVTDLGLDKQATEAAIKALPSQVTLAFSPYATDLENWIGKARKGGHEVMMMAPAEGSGYPARDPGPMALLVSLSAEDNLTRLEKVMSRAAGYVGIGMLGTRLGVTEQFGTLMAEIKDRGLLFVGESAPPADDRAPPSAMVTAIVDQDPFREAIDARLGLVAEAARRDGRAVAVASARPVTLDRLVTWLAKLQEDKIAPAPASAVVKLPENPG